MLGRDPQGVPIRIGVPPVEDFVLAVSFADQIAPLWLTGPDRRDEISGQDQVIAIGELNTDDLSIVSFVLRPDQSWLGR